ncbi:nucleotidyltransferase [Bacillaceae bacterium IKA-2]|nr:nucleotidyltransferase [Bacillaceae bacterium IKA-2]
MNATGLIVEYNPFHNGHAHHVYHSKIETNADVVIAVMSGNFLQRGEPALVSKWSRTNMALAAGVDVVLELPYVYATQKAEIFARGAISILSAIGVNSICFGSESGNINEFDQLHSFIKQQEDTYNLFIKEALKKGDSYPRALATAFKRLENSDDILDLSLPNNILGYHYVKAIYEQKSPIKPFTIKREAAQYHDKEVLTQSIASATSIREALIKKKDDLNSIKHVVPRETFNELKSHLKYYNSFQDWERLFPYLKYKVLTASREELTNIYEAEEGLENRISKLISNSSSFQELMINLKTKRYTWARLQRFCLHILTNTTKQDMSFTRATCPYIRILGMNSKGKTFINQRKKQLSIPLVPTISKFKHPMIDVEVRANSSYSLGYTSSIQTKILKAEYGQPPIFVK